MSSKSSRTWGSLSSASVYTSTDYAIDVNEFLDSIYLKATWTLGNGSNKTFTDGDVSVADDEVTITSHGWTTGMKVSGLTSTGTLPAGLATSTAYWVYVKDANTVKFATSAANLAAGTYVDITAAAGGGTHTVTMATAAGTIKYWYSSDGSSKDLEVDATGADMAAVAKYIEVVSVIPCKYIIAEVGVTAGVAVVSALAQGPRK